MPAALEPTRLRAISMATLIHVQGKAGLGAEEFDLGVTFLLDGIAAHVGRRGAG